MKATLSNFLKRFTPNATVHRSAPTVSRDWPDEGFAGLSSAYAPTDPASLKRRVEHLVATDALAAASVSTLVSQTVSGGVLVTCDDEEAERAFNYDPLDPARKQSSTAIQELVIRHLVVAGEFLALHREINGRYALQILDADQLDRGKTAELDDGSFIASGVECDRFGRILGYWILPALPNDFRNVSTESIRFDAEDVVHAFERTRPGQTRGVSALAPILPMLESASTAQEAGLTKLKVAAIVAGIVVSADGDDAFTGDINPTLEPGSVIRLRPGESFQSFQGGEAGDLPAFLKNTHRLVAAAIGTSYEALTADVSDTNYSSARFGDQNAKRRAESRRWHVLIEQVLEPMFRRWNAVEVMAGRRADALEPDWIDPAWPSIDPTKDAEAETAWLNAGLKSRKEIIAASGRDPKTVMAEIKADADRPTKGADQ